MLPGLAPAANAFFLLSDASYGSTEQARVRLEVADMGGVSEAGGVDIAVYRVKDPLPFLAAQRNLHRIQLQPQPAQDGLWALVSRSWDRFAQKARAAWRRLFSPEAREHVLQQNPDLARRADSRTPSPQRVLRQFGPVPGMEQVAVFRYPVQFAKPITAPDGVVMQGSSSEWIGAQDGNVHVPLGKLKPGLYVVEAAVGKERAVTAVFVADTVVVTKVSSGQMLAWTVHRQSGAPVAKAESWWTDGRGVLARASANARGLAEFTRQSPERSFVYGRDPDGGVFISENFYYDSEIYNTKVYAVTERPLYRPGDSVYVKIWAREFLNARDSRSVGASPVTVAVLDPNGNPIARQKVQLNGDAGGNTSFRLPDNAPPGGYELRLQRGNDSYTAAFRVSEYQKPHFEIAVKLDKTAWKTGEPVTGRLQLRYPDGKPVKEAKVDLLLRSQQMTIVEGDLRYMGQFPVKLEAESLASDASGDVRITLPAADKPSRYVLSALATDGAAYRVRVTQEILIERAASTWRLQAARQFSAPGEAMSFALSAEGGAGAAPATWTWLRLEDRAEQTGAVTDPRRLDLTFPRSGSYSLSLKDAAGNILGATQHWVSGNGVEVAPGNIEIVFDKPAYHPGETATALVSFPEATRNVLLTLERDKVEKNALLAEGDAWVKTKQLSERQWQVSVPVQDLFAPNITFSAAYVKDNRFVFQNQGIRVEQPSIKLDFKPEREVYRPGERVNIDITATLQGKPVATTLSVGIVDEMIYVLQPEIAPDIREFFYHARRNNVRTTASFSFIGYDVATTALGDQPRRAQVNERAIKVLERPRRDNIDTVYWNPAITTGADGRTRISFTMPDALTRWRITARAMNTAGAVGQATSWVRSDKPYYIKWTSPDWLRQGDKPQASIALFNQGNGAVSADLVLGEGLALRRNVVLKPGINFEAIPLDDYKGGRVVAALESKGVTLDSLEVSLRQLGVRWRTPQGRWLTLNAKSSVLDLPADAHNVRVHLAPTVAEHFSRVAGDLMDYPYGCIEQTSSRMIPMVLAYRSLLSSDPARAQELARLLYSQRLRLAHMATPEGRFGWWGSHMAADPFLTGWAYYADWNATQALEVTLPAEHWQVLLNVYSDGAAGMTPWQRALMLDWMRQMKLPVGSLVAGVLNDLQRTPAASLLKARDDGIDSALLVDNDTAENQARAFVLAGHMAMQLKVAVPAALQQRIVAAGVAVNGSKAPLDQALMLYTRQLPPTIVTTLLPRISQDYPTMDRAVMLAWMASALGGYGKGAPLGTLVAPWQKFTTIAGGSHFRVMPGQLRPATLTLTAAPVKPLAAYVTFESALPAAKSLPVRLDRRLYRLTANADGAFARTEVRDGEAVSTDELYLDEIRLAPNGNGRPLRYGIVEVPLPPGAALETGTWGISLLEGSRDGVPLEAARAEATSYGYAVPVEALGGSTVLRHLVRFAQKGRFQLPSSRFYSMYNAEAQAYEDGQDSVRMLNVR